MGDVTISRGIGFLEDSVSALDWSFIHSSNVTTGALSSDGDIMSQLVTFTSAVNGNYGGVSAALLPGAIVTNTWPKIKVRHKDSGLGANPDFVLEVDYTDATSQTFNLVKGTSLIVETFTLNTGKTIATDGIKLYLKANASLTGTFTLYVDFVIVYEEDLTLPGIIQPLPVSAGRIIAVLPILQREGEVLQDLGSKSPEIIIQGALVSTTTPTNHTAAEWWDILEGLVLEGANETWQWVSSDRIHYKYLPIDLTRSEHLSRKNYYEFTLRLKRFDVLSQTADRLGINY